VSRRARLECRLKRSITLDHALWIVLKFLHEFLEAVFLSVVLKLLLNTHSIWWGHTKKQTRVPAQEVHNS